MKILGGWSDPKARYAFDPDKATLEPTDANGAVRGLVERVRTGVPLVGRPRVLWVVEDAGGLALGVDDEIYRTIDAPVRVSLTSVVPFFKRLSIAHGDRTVFSEVIPVFGLSGDFPDDMLGTFPSFLRHAFSSERTVAEYSRQWSEGDSGEKYSRE